MRPSFRQTPPSALLEEDHFHSAVGGALGGIVSAGTSADYGKIVFHMLCRALDKGILSLFVVRGTEGNGGKRTKERTKGTF